MPRRASDFVSSKPQRINIEEEETKRRHGSKEDREGRKGRKRQNVRKGRQAGNDVKDWQNIKVVTDMNHMKDRKGKTWKTEK